MLIEFAVVGGSTVLWRKLGRKGNRLPEVVSRNLPAPVRREQNKNKDNQDKFDGRQLMSDLKSVLLKDERRELQKDIDPDIEASEEHAKKRGGKNMLFSAGALGLAILGTTSPAFYLLGSAAVIYLGRHVYRMVWQDLKRGQLISVYLVSAILMLGMITTGQLLYSAVAGLLSGFLVRLIKKAEDSSQKQLTNIFSGHPQQVWIEKEGVELQVGFDSVRKGDIVIVQAGEVIPVDGVIRDGSANIDQHILTGESQPVDRGVGEAVFAATLILAGRVSILVETAGEETVAANIGNVLNNTKNYKDHLMLRGKRIADKLLPIELAASVVTLGLLGPLSAIAVLWSGLGYRMIMFGPISVLNYLQILSRRGILVKDGRVLESLQKVDTVVFDKTGTLTEEQPTIGAIHLLADYDERQILHFAASAEHRQTHPVAQAIIDKADAHGVIPSVPDDTSYEVGYGIKVQVAQQTIRVGSARFMQREGLSLPEQVGSLQEQAEEQGHSLIYVGVDEIVAGVLEMQPSIRPEAQQLIESLKQRGIGTYIISGDHEKPTRTIARQLGVDHYFAETLPENKAELVRQLRDEGKFVCFIGDGINDAIALKSAHISISLKGASSAATDTAQIIFMDGTLEPLERLFGFADEFERTMHRNLLVSLAPGIINIGGIYLLHFGVATSMTLFYSGTTAGLANTIYPLIKHQDKGVPALEKQNQPLQSDID